MENELTHSADYGRDIDPDEAREVEAFLDRTGGMLRDRVYSILDISEPSEKDEKREEFRQLILEGLKAKHSGLDAEELRVLTGFYMDKLESLWDRSLARKGK